MELLNLPSCHLIGGEISVPGDVRHVRLDEQTSTEQDGAHTNERTQRTTLREVKDLEGHKAAKVLESRLRSRLSNLAPRSGFGRLCPVSRAEALTTFLAEAREAAAAFNAEQATRAGRHYLRVTLIAARITSDDEAAAREVAADLRAITAELAEAVGKADRKAIYEATAKARQIAGILGEREKMALDEARRAATLLARRLLTEGERKGRLVDEIREDLDLSPVSRARAMFLEFDVPEDVKAAAGEPVSAVMPRSLELDESPDATEDAEVLADSGPAAVAMASAMSAA